MIIRDTHFVFNLYVKDLQNDQELFDDYFETLDLLNQFLYKWGFYENVETEVLIQVCKKHNDDLTLLFEYPLKLVHPIDKNEYDSIMEGLEEWTKPKVTGLTSEIEDDDKSVKNKDLTRYKYVCPRCFNELDKCTCSSYPYYLVRIDKNILEAVKNLNLKNYRTGSSCEGHLDELVPSIGIKFDNDYCFDVPFPKGFYYDASGYLGYKIVGESDEEKLVDKNRALDDLIKWTELL